MQFLCRAYEINRLAKAEVFPAPQCKESRRCNVSSGNIRIALLTSSHARVKGSEPMPVKGSEPIWLKMSEYDGKDTGVLSISLRISARLHTTKTISLLSNPRRIGVFCFSGSAQLRQQLIAVSVAHTFGCDRR